MRNSSTSSRFQREDDISTRTGALARSRRPKGGRSHQSCSTDDPCTAPNFIAVSPRRDVSPPLRLTCVAHLCIRRTHSAGSPRGRPRPFGTTGQCLHSCGMPQRSGEEASNGRLEPMTLHLCRGQCGVDDVACARPGPTRSDPSRLPVSPSTRTATVTGARTRAGADHSTGTACSGFVKRSAWEHGAGP